MKPISYSELLKTKEKSKITYQDLLCTDEWKNKRKQIISRDNKRCTKCNLSETNGFAHYDEKTKIYSYITDNGKEEIRYVINKEGIVVCESIAIIIIVNKPYHLQVHHKYYIYNNLPWDYDQEALIALCNWCHAEVHQNEKIHMYDNFDQISFQELIPCNRCNGTGWFSQYSHIQGGICFKCNGRRFKKKLINYDENFI
ncbi:hypothetical protein [Flavobacterium sp. HTF]|uniref:hypothetical protein n=1 Tax=Flavobacterium sp. HTF TaxID=2170732 RepID=UPI000D5DD42D|nr:hypothetical protein [Flavobacterium sp. HTF]PWB22799.1 hypothetical protein DCO46_16280 [Flavobacterium sp. HTF]